jgi:hypothetical protein
VPSDLKGCKVLSSVSGTKPAFMPADRIRGGGVCSAPCAGRDESFSNWQECRTNKKGPSALAGGPSVSPIQNGASSEAGSGADACAGTSASARLNRRTELARTLQKIANFQAFAFLDLPFSRSYFELTSCPSTRTWSPLWSVSAMDSPRRLNATTRCHSVLACHSSFESFDDCWVATDSTVKFPPLPRTCRFSGSFPGNEAIYAPNADFANAFEVDPDAPVSRKQETQQFET